MSPPPDGHRWLDVTRTLEEHGVLDTSCDPSDRARQDRFLELTWPHLKTTGVSWIGFYFEAPDTPVEERLVLGPARGGPACSPIGLHGACGQVHQSGTPLVVHDVADLGGNYIACDPRDRSELVIPILTDKRPLGVLDLDSHAVGAFTGEDARCLEALLVRAGLSAPRSGA